MRFRKPVHAEIIPLLALAACESQEPPAACGVIPQVTVNAGDTATVTACFDDPNGDALVYSAVSSNPALLPPFASAASPIHANSFNTICHLRGAIWL